MNVRGYTRDGQEWVEGTTTSDVCKGGVSVALSRALAMGQVLHLALPLPEIFRRYDTTSPSYRVWALVRYATSEGPPFRAGAMFLGRNPPRGFEENPGGLFFLPDDPQPLWLARAQRYPLLVTVRLRRLDEGRQGAPEEVTITDDVSLAGAKVRTTLPVVRGEMVQLAEVDGPFRVSAMVQNLALGADNALRLNLHFLDEASAATAVRDLLRRHGIALNE